MAHRMMELRRTQKYAHICTLSAPVTNFDHCSLFSTLSEKRPTTDKLDTFQINTQTLEIISLILKICITCIYIETVKLFSYKLNEVH